MITTKVLHPYVTFELGTFKQKDEGSISILKIGVTNLKQEMQFILE